MISASQLRARVERLKNKFSACLLSGLLIAAGCQGEQKCKYKPEPIFKQGLPHILQYNFERQGTQSLESMMLDTQVLVEIYQDVCQQSRQEYHFTVQGDFSRYPDSTWMKEATRQLVFLSSFSPAQASLRPWADIIENFRHDMRLGEDREVQQGIFVNINRVAASDKSTLVVTLTQK